MKKPDTRKSPVFSVWSLGSFMHPAAISYLCFYLQLLRAVAIINPSSSSCSCSTREGASIITSRPELFFGKAMQSRMLSSPAKSETSLSKPKAIPPCGGAPYLKAFIRKPNCSWARSSVNPSTENIFFCNALS